MSVGVMDLKAKEGKPAYVEFFQAAKHMPVMSERMGHYVAKDVDYVTVRQLGSADSVKFEVDAFFRQCEQDVRSERMPKQFLDYYKESYTRWKAGQEMPLQGSPLKSWPVASPAQIQACISAGIRTVEELASVGDEGLRKIGLGSVDLQNKAKAWLQAAGDKGQVVMEVANLKQENAMLKGSLDSLMEQVKALQAQQDAKAGTISADDLLEDKPKRGPGRPRKED